MRETLTCGRTVRNDEPEVGETVLLGLRQSRVLNTVESTYQRLKKALYCVQLNTSILEYLRRILKARDGLIESLAARCCRGAHCDDTGCDLSLIHI